MSNASSEQNQPRTPSLQAPPQPIPAKEVKVSWGPAAAILVTALAMGAAYLVAGLFAYALPSILGWSQGQAEAWLNSVAGQFIFVALAESVVVGVIVWFLARRGTTIRALGFRRKPSITDITYVIATFGLYFIFVAVVTSLAKAFLHVDLDQKQELGFDTVVTAGDKILAFMSLVIIPPAVEEILFRGFLFSGLRTKLPFVWATVLTSGLFASLHLAEGAGGVLWVAGIDTFILSIFLCYVREKTGNLWAGIMLHGCKNLVAFLYLYVFVR